MAEPLARDLKAKKQYFMDDDEFHDYVHRMGMVTDSGDVDEKEAHRIAIEELFERRKKSKRRH